MVLNVYIEMNNFPVSKEFGVLLGGTVWKKKSPTMITWGCMFLVRNVLMRKNEGLCPSCDSWMLVDISGFFGLSRVT